MRALLPGPSGELDDLGLAEHYREPYGALARPGRGWLRANMVASVDGAASVAGTSRGLGSPADQRLLGVLRALADVVLVGAGTVRVERYGPTRPRPSLVGLRRDRGQQDSATLAVVSGRLDLDPSSPLFTEAAQRTVVLTQASAPADRAAALARVADVVVCGDERVDLARATAELTGRGMLRQLTEGGPHLLGRLVAADLVDEVSLSLSPLLVGVAPTRILAGTPGPSEAAPTRLRLAGLLHDEDMLFARYVRQERP